MIKNLSWETLEDRYRRWKIYFESNTNNTLRNSHSKKLALKFGVVKNSFFYSVVPIWNSLPPNTSEQTNSDVFLDLCKAQISVNWRCGHFFFLFSSQIIDIDLMSLNEIFDDGNDDLHIFNFVSRFDSRFWTPVSMFNR